MPLPKLRSNPFLHNSFFIFIIRFFPSLASLVVLIYYSRQLDKAVYGSYQNFWIQLNFIYPIACFGIHALIITYAPATIVRLFKSLTRQQLIMYGLWLTGLSAGFGVLQGISSDVGFVVPALFMMSYAANIIVESSLVLFKDFRKLALINFLYAVAYLGIHKAAVDTGFLLYNLFLWLLLLNLTRLLVSFVIMNKGAAKFLTDEHVETRSGVEIRKLWVHLGFYDILQAFSTWVDKFVVSVVLPASLSGIYFNGAQNIPFLPLILNAAGSSVLMQMVRVKKDDESASLLELSRQSGKYLSCIVFPLFLFLLFYRYELFEVLLPDYIVSVPVFFVSLFILPFRAYSFITVFQKLHKGHIGNIGAVMELVVACALMYPLYKWLGLPGVALSFIISTYLQGIYYVYHMSRLLNTSMLHVLPLGNWLKKMSIFGVLLFAMHYLSVKIFDANLTVFLGAIAMGIVIVGSLVLEISSSKKRSHG